MHATKLLPKLQFEEVIGLITHSSIIIGASSIYCTSSETTTFMNQSLSPISSVLRKSIWMVIFLRLNWERSTTRPTIGSIGPSRDRVDAERTALRWHGVRTDTGPSNFLHPPAARHLNLVLISSHVLLQFWTLHARSFLEQEVPGQWISPSSSGILCCEGREWVRQWCVLLEAAQIQAPQSKLDNEREWGLQRASWLLWSESCTYQKQGEGLLLELQAWLEFRDPI